MDRRETLSLLRDQHTFPTTWRYRMVVRAESMVEVIGAVRALLGSRVLDIAEHPSSKGTYVSLRVEVSVASAEDVLDVYPILQGLDGVMTTM